MQGQTIQIVAICVSAAAAAIIAILAFVNHKLSKTIHRSSLEYRERTERLLACLMAAMISSGQLVMSTERTKLTDLRTSWKAAQNFMNELILQDAEMP